MKSSDSLYHRRRFPAEIISHCVLFYFRFSLSYREVEEIMAARGVVFSYETIRDWASKFGGTYAKRMRSRAVRPGDHWYLVEVYLSINGKFYYLWRAVDQDGEVLDILVQPRRNKQTAKKFFRKLLNKLQYVPPVIVTDKLCSYGAAKAEILPEVLHIQDKGKTTVLKIRFSLRGNENAACEYSNQQDMLTDFWQALARFHRSSK